MRATTLFFDPREALALLRRATTTKLRLVKDRGVYLMSGRGLIYAEGYGPDADPEKIHDVSGDDCCVPVECGRDGLDEFVRQLEAGDILYATLVACPSTYDRAVIGTAPTRDEARASGDEFLLREEMGLPRDYYVD